MQRRIAELSELPATGFDDLHDTVSQFQIQVVMATRLLQSAGEANAPRAQELVGQLQQLLKEQWH